MISPQFFMLFRVYMERIDPQWRRRWDKRPQKEFQSAVEVMRRFLDRPENTSSRAMERSCWPPPWHGKSTRNVAQTRWTVAL